MSPTGRHVTAAEALQLGIVDQVTDHDTVDVAVKFALSVAGETQKKKRMAHTRCPLVLNQLALHRFKNLLG